MKEDYWFDASRYAISCFYHHTQKKPQCGINTEAFVTSTYSYLQFEIHTQAQISEAIAKFRRRC